MSRYFASSSTMTMRPALTAMPSSFSLFLPRQEGLEVILHDVVGKPVDLHPVEVVSRRRVDTEEPALIHVASNLVERRLLKIAGQELLSVESGRIEEVENELVEPRESQGLLVVVAELFETKQEIWRRAREACSGRGGLRRPDVTGPQRIELIVPADAELGPVFLEE